ncbi:MAG: hypothetical protein RIR00_87, partial [Pseudomonadota bacterium]
MAHMNTVLLLGALMLGGLCSGEFFRRILNLPRTTGYALFGLLSGRHGFGWIDHQLIDSATLFIDLALGLIVFELGQKLHSEELHCSGKRILLVGFCESLVSFLAVLLLLHTLGFSLGVAAFAAGIAISTSPAITIATCSDVGARGPHSQLLFHLVAINGCLAIGFISLISPLLNAGNLDASLVWLGIQSIAISTAIGLCGALAILAGARLLG